MIDVQSVTKRYGKFTAVQNLSFKVGKSSIYGLVGYNGAGKTTLLKTIAGVFKADGGKVLIDGKDVFKNAEVRQNLFYVPDDIYFEPYTTMSKMADFYKGYYPNFSQNTFDKLVKVFELNKDARLSSFSKGMQRQAEMILGMSTHPQVLLLDESFDGLDPAKRNTMNNMLLEYMAEKECSIIISSHNLHELTDICDHIGLINGKRIVLDCSTEEISGSRCKFRLVFADDKEQNDFKDLDVKKFHKDGRIITISVNGDSSEAERKIAAMSPLMLEKFPLTLEEIFLEEMEGTDYDFKEIFG